ncbi:MAG: hypothetical protein JW945_01445 [Methanomicrobia archaeon]|nr:hypothetical protein [Methanomicrobia archaeon]
MKLEKLSATERLKLLKLLGLFVLLGAFLMLALLPLVSAGPLPIWTPWFVLSAGAIVWFVIELFVEKPTGTRLKKALVVAIFLVVFDFIFENSGTIFNLWYSSNSLVPVCMPIESIHPACVPIEVMLVILFGGAAWALYVPQDFKLTYSVLDLLLIATFGAIGEYILIQFGLMHYLQWWTSLYAFLSYVATWILLHLVKYRIVG